MFTCADVPLRVHSQPVLLGRVEDLLVVQVPVEEGCDDAASKMSQQNVPDDSVGGQEVDDPALGALRRGQAQNCEEYDLADENPEEACVDDCFQHDMDYIIDIPVYNQCAMVMVMANLGGVTND